MQDDFVDAAAMKPRPRRSGGGYLLVALLAFALGAGAAGALVWQGKLDRFLPRRSQAATVAAQPMANPAATQGVALSAVESRLALLEDRFSRIDFVADRASGNAARAEGLLIALSARRLVDRGEPLGYVADQLRLRFAGAQPQAVDTILTFANAPVTADQLSARLEALSPDLTNTSQDLSWWERARLEVTGLFVVRSDSSTLAAPSARIQRARLMLAEGRTAGAIDEVGRLPGADHADKWMEDARRYDAAQKALDLIETTAMLEPRRLRDGEGRAIEQESPIAQPGSPPEPEPVPLESDVPAT